MLQGAAQKIEAKIAKVTDTSGEDIKNSQLQHPLRITVRKSPVLINYRLFQVGVRVGRYGVIIVGTLNVCM